jgi:hypothetical protein
VTNAGAYSLLCVRRVCCSDQEHVSELCLHAIQMGVQCAVNGSDLKDKTVSTLHDLLSKTLDRNKDRQGISRPHTGCLELAQACCTGLTELCIRYTDLSGGVINFVRSILLTSKRLCRHPREKELRQVMVRALSEICKSELSHIKDLVIESPPASPTAVTTVDASPSLSLRALGAGSIATAPDAKDGLFLFSATQTRKLVIGLLNGLWRNESTAYYADNIQPRESIVTRDDHTPEHSSIRDSATDESNAQLQRVLTTLLQLTSLINQPKVTQLVLPTLLQRYPARPFLFSVCALLSCS